MMRRAVLATSAALVTVAVALAVPDGASASGDPEPIAVFGDLPAGTTDVTLTVLPRMNGATPGAKLVPVAVEASGVTVDDGHFTASVDPADVPVGFVSADGLVDFQVSAANADGQAWVSVVTSRLVATPKQADGTWADPVDTSDAGATLRHARVAGKQSVPRLSASAAARLELEDDDGSEVGRYAATDRNCVSVQYATPTSNTRRRWATTGTTYPVGATTARLNYSSSKGARYGAAVNINGVWSVSGSMFVGGGWGSDWHFDGAQRSYQVETLYRQWKYRCTDEQYHYWDQLWWLPEDETGGTRTNTGIDRPSWNNPDYCANISSNATWRRDTSSGNEYKYGYAVKFQDIIGIDLSISHSYGETMLVAYDVPKGSAQTKLYGNNARPTRAGKFIQRVGKC
jgi:hypothetical protein